MKDFKTCFISLSLALMMAGCSDSTPDEPDVVPPQPETPVDPDNPDEEEPYKGFNAYYVSPESAADADGTIGKPFSSIRDALQHVASGDTVFVCPGEYVEHSIKPPVSGTPEAMVVIKAVSAGTAIIKHPGTNVSDATQLFDLTGRSYIRIDGLRFSGFKYGKASVRLRQSTGCIISNNIFEDLGNNEIAAYDATHVINCTESSHNIIANNRFERCYGDAISISSSSRENLVVSNTFIDLYGKPRSWAGPNGGVFSAAMNEGSSGEAGNNLFAFNKAENIQKFFWFDRDGSRNIALRNVVKNGESCAFNESRCVGNIFMENIGYDCYRTAFDTAKYDTGDEEDTQWINNVAYNCKGGFAIDKAHRSTFRNNIVVFSSGYDFTLTERAAGFGPHTFTGNLWYNPSKEKSISYRGKAITPQEFGETVNDDVQVFGDPIFKNPANGDFTLSTDSPAKGKGVYGNDLGAYSVYGPTAMGQTETSASLYQSPIEAQFGAFFAALTSNGSATVAINLNRPSKKAVTVRIAPVAGDLRNNVDFTIDANAVTFNPGETTSNISIHFSAKGERDQIVAFRIVSATNASIGPTSTFIVKVTRTN